MIKITFNTKAEITIRYATPINVVAFSILVVSFLLSFKFDRIDNISKILGFWINNIFTGNINNFV